MNAQKIFRFWLTMSAFWIGLLLLWSGERWKLPYPVKEAWEKQVFMLRQGWN